MEEKTMFEKLYSINVNEHTEEKNGLTYLTWSYAWAEFKKIYPNATYEIKKFGENNLPYVFDENTGYMVFTSVTVEDLTYEMWLPVMDGANKSMKDEEYTYSVKEYQYGKWTGGYIDKTVEPATMFDINKTIMRCLVKNLAMFGLGLYIYAGEDLPEEQKEAETKITQKQAKDLIELIKQAEVDSKIATEIYKKYGYDRTAEIKQKDYTNIVNEIRAFLKAGGQNENKK